MRSCVRVRSCVCVFALFLHGVRVYFSRPVLLFHFCACLHYFLKLPRSTRVCVFVCLDTACSYVVGWGWWETQCLDEETLWPALYLDKTLGSVFAVQHWNHKQQCKRKHTHRDTQTHTRPCVLHFPHHSWLYVFVESDLERGFWMIPISLVKELMFHPDLSQQRSHSVWIFTEAGKTSAVE